MKRPWRIGRSVLLSLTFMAAHFAGAEESPTAARTPRQWGAETLADIQQSFFMPQQGLYMLELNGPRKPHPAWIWDASIQLGALCSAARQEPAEYLPRVRAYAMALRTHRTTYQDRPGLDVNPPPKPPDRYYDDNAWISIALLEAYELTKDPQDLALATDAFNFTMSGEDDKTFGGGIYWHEDQTKSKNACSSGPAMLAALRFHKVTGEQKYLDTAKRLYDWTRKTLQDTDGLVFDSISVPDGKIDRRKFTYNSATLVHAAVLLHQAVGDKGYLDEARRIARAAEKQFVREGDGALRGSGKLAVKLIEAWLVLADADKDDHWRAVVSRSLSSLHSKRNESGFYPQDWNAPPLPKDRPVRLIDQSAPARAYWLAAEHHVDIH